ncbi:MAG: 30S ribosomal protein S17 [Acidobacteriota bacterium]|jgi:small subunit ribosomal protein S17|uniref:Small ribosomal subunit protein uS17 n=1 Tax=Thermoanaerobaculum aquaticum TaxID=1312852 RepID=A0A062Y2K9_9BACT|nr:30S ribosomal protein S17 [Thermoanaerobaculum aquaticum]KDA54656.1 30S ribosomal protein S17 [Thermoanaerobaculum aquaticum]BCW92949.1 MAG: 30S ribosomal protein S17 [Thermoanaerobaculum sp.]GBC78945.1 30S ribosomal protein S17 [bacterium HR09]
MENRGESRKTVKVGTVVSLAGAKSVVVQVESMVMHPLYHRFVKRSRKFMAHDENGECGLGDKVQIVECRPLSRRKRFRVQRVIERAK